MHSTQLFFTETYHLWLFLQHRLDAVWLSFSKVSPAKLWSFGITLPATCAPWCKQSSEIFAPDHRLSTVFGRLIPLIAHRSNNTRWNISIPTDRIITS